MGDGRGRRPVRRGGRRARRAAADVVGLGATIELADGAEGRVEVAPGITVWFRVEGSGRSVVLVPTTGNHPDLRRLVVPGRTVVFCDARGRGRSDPVGVHDAGFAEEVGDVERLRQAFGLERFAALGWSYHAGVLAAYALAHPGRVERLVLVASIPPRADARPGPARQPAPHQVAHLDQLEAAGRRETDPAALCRAWREVYVPLLMGRREAFERLTPVCDLPNEHPWAVARSLVHVFAQLQRYDWRPLLRDLDAPTLVVHGTEDHEPVEHALEWVHALADGRLLELDGVGQLPWVEDPDRFFAVVDRFLAGEPV